MLVACRLDDLTAHPGGDLVQFALLVSRGLIDGGNAEVENGSSHDFPLRLYPEGIMRRRNNRPIFRTATRGVKIARFVGILASNFRWVYSHI